MAKFQFRLATLLRLGESVRDERRGQLAEAYRADEMLEQRQGMVAGELASLRTACRNAVTPGNVDLDRIVESQRYELALRAQQKHLTHQRKAVEGEIERRREALLAANREVRVLEKLRERQEERHRHEEARRDIRQLDEAAAVRVGRTEEES
ncbi:MAG: flagellar export protein FliJ [Thermoguttaceae bacterium]|jgi:flagellar export protein FliJ|nr:flagellar export protein FliJ [Thermoguttaceae bacterium]